jgi:hypothetical protein
MYALMYILFSFCMVGLWANACISSYQYLKVRRRARKALYVGTGLVFPAILIILFELMLPVFVPQTGSLITLDDVRPDFAGAISCYAVCVSLWTGTWFIIRYCSAHRGKLEPVRS